MVVDKNVVGFIGLGSLGSEIAKRLVGGGFNLVVYDVQESAVSKLVNEGAQPAKSPRDVADKTELVITSLPGPVEAEIVSMGTDGLVNGKKIKVLLELSTIGPRMSRYLVERLGEKGIEIFDCPVVGGTGPAPVVAKKGELTCMLSGKQEVFEEVKSIIERISSKQVYLGNKPGMAQAMKIINSMLSATALCITSEAMVLGLKEGLDPEKMLEVFNNGTAKNSATEIKFPRYVINRTFNYGFKTKLMYKDIKLYIEEAIKEEGLALLSASVAESWKMGNSMFGEEDYTSIVKLAEYYSGVIVEGKETQRRNKLNTGDDNI